LVHLTKRGATGSGFQPAMVRAHSRACAVSVMAGNSRRSSMAADLAVLIEDGADRCGLCLTDHEHPGSMGTHVAAGKRERRTPRSDGGSNSPTYRQGALPGD
jgi:hypothetical protein